MAFSAYLKKTHQTTEASNLSQPSTSSIPSSSSISPPSLPHSHSLTFFSLTSNHFIEINHLVAVNRKTLDQSCFLRLSCSRCRNPSEIRKSISRPPRMLPLLFFFPSFSTTPRSHVHRLNWNSALTDRDLAAPPRIPLPTTRRSHPMRNSLEFPVSKKVSSRSFARVVRFVCSRGS
jgi:hypothetical protein